VWGRKRGESVITGSKDVTNEVEVYTMLLKSVAISTGEGGGKQYMTAD